MLEFTLVHCFHERGQPPGIRWPKKAVGTTYDGIPATILHAYVIFSTFYALLGGDIRAF